MDAVEHQQGPFAGADVGDFVHAHRVVCLDENKNPPTGDGAGENEGNRLGEADVGMRGIMPLAGAFPGAEIPSFQYFTQFRAIMHPKFHQDLVGMAFDGIGGDVQLSRYFGVGVIQADQRGYFLLTRREAFPT